MGVRRSSKRDEALHRFLASDGKITSVELAGLLGVSDSLMRKWKSLDKWSAILAMPPEERRKHIKAHIGAPFGNKNAVGNPGGHGTIGNKNAVGHGPPKGTQNNLQTGEYEVISLDNLEEEEQQLYDSISCDPVELIDENIRLLKIRERRMLKRLTLLYQQKEKISLSQSSAEWGKHDEETAPRRKSITKTEQFLVDKIIQLEDALSRVQDRIMNAVERKCRLLDKMSVSSEKGHSITFSFDRGDLE